MMTNATPDLLGFDSLLDLVVLVLLAGVLPGLALITAGVIRLRRHHHGADNKTSTKETR